MKKILITAITALLVGCSAKTELHESDLHGCWYISMTSLHQSCLSINSDHTYKMMLASKNIYMNGTQVNFKREYYEGTWSLVDNNLMLHHSEAESHVLYNIGIDDGRLSFQFKADADNEPCIYKGFQSDELRQSAINGTWSFSERQVLPSVYDMVMTLDDSYHARMTFSTPNGNHGHDIVDWKDIDYSIVGHYIVFKGITPMYYFERITKQDGNIEYASGNNQGNMIRFSAKPQDPTAHELRLDGFIF